MCVWCIQLKHTNCNVLLQIYIGNFFFLRLIKYSIKKKKEKVAEDTIKSLVERGKILIYLDNSSVNGG